MPRASNDALGRIDTKLIRAHWQPPAHAMGSSNPLPAVLFLNPKASQPHPSCGEVLAAQQSLLASCLERTNGPTVTQRKPSGGPSAPHRASALGCTCPTTDSVFRIHTHSSWCTARENMYCRPRSTPRAPPSTIRPSPRPSTPHTQPLTEAHDDTRQPVHARTRRVAEPSPLPILRPPPLEPGAARRTTGAGRAHARPGRARCPAPSCPSAGAKRATRIGPRVPSTTHQTGRR